MATGVLQSPFPLVDGGHHDSRSTFHGLLSALGPGSTPQGLIRDKETPLSDPPDPICPLCGRPIPPGVAQSLHHLIPKLRGGKGGPVVLLHHICHREIHATLSESALARDYNTVAALRTHPRLAKFIRWIAARPPGFQSKVPGKRRGR